jgi:hypothetical protein
MSYRCSGIWKPNKYMRPHCKFQNHPNSWDYRCMALYVSPFFLSSTPKKAETDEWASEKVVSWEVLFHTIKFYFNPKYLSWEIPESQQNISKLLVGSMLGIHVADAWAGIWITWHALLLSLSGNSHNHLQSLMISWWINNCVLPTLHFKPQVRSLSSISFRSPLGKVLINSRIYKFTQY